MNTNTPIRRRDDLVELYAIPQRIIADFSALWESRPEMAKSVLGDIQAMIGSSPKSTTPSKSSSGTTNFDKLCAFLETNHDGVTKKQVVDGTTLSEATLHSLLYTTHKDHFELTKNPAGGLAKLIRLKGAIP